MRVIGINSAIEHAFGQMKTFVYLRSKYSQPAKYEFETLLALSNEIRVYQNDI